MWIWSTKMRRVGKSKEENACWTSPTPRLALREAMQEAQVESLLHAWRHACAIHGEKSHVQHTHTHLRLPELGSQLYPQFPGFRTLQGSSHYATCCCCCYLGPKELQLIQPTAPGFIHSSLLPHNRSFPSLVLVFSRYYFCVCFFFFWAPILRRIRAYHLEAISINK